VHGEGEAHHHDLAQPRTAVTHGEQARRHRRLHHRHLRAAVVEQELVLLGRHERVDGNSDGPQLDGAPEGGRKRGSVVEHEQDAILDFHSEGGQGMATATRGRGHLAIRHRAARTAKGGARRAPAVDMAIDEEAGGVEVFRKLLVLHRRNGTGNTCRTGRERM
jgi:hypothetical protein